MFFTHQSVEVYHTYSALLITPQYALLIVYSANLYAFIVCLSVMLSTLHLAVSTSVHAFQKLFWVCVMVMNDLLCGMGIDITTV
jgi:hypothetical protein